MATTNYLQTASQNNISVNTDPRILNTLDNSLKDYMDPLFTAATESSFRGSGWGSFKSTWHNYMTNIDRFGVNPMPANHEVSGLTFITRPKLNLRSKAISTNRTLSTLNTMDINSLEFAIRCYLDWKLSKWAMAAPYAQASQFHNSDLPFIVPLTNSLRSINGFPDWTIDTETSEGGFFAEDQTIARGGDMGNRSYQININFQDVQGGIVMAIFIYWVLYIALVTKGGTIAYMEDIEKRQLNYTCSIYRYVLDPSKRYITKWAKATGCFPISVPIGNCFNIGERESYLSSSESFSIPFQCNHVEYMDPIILQDFNTVIDFYYGGNIESVYKNGVLFTRKTGAQNYGETAGGSGRTASDPSDPASNFRGIPYIDLYGGANELRFWCLPEELEDPIAPAIDQITEQLLTNGY